MDADAQITKSNFNDAESVPDEKCEKIKKKKRNKEKNFIEKKEGLKGKKKTTVTLFQPTDKRGVVSSFLYSSQIQKQKEPLFKNYKRKKKKFFSICFSCIFFFFLFPG